MEPTPVERKDLATELTRPLLEILELMTRCLKSSSALDSQLRKSLLQAELRTIYLLQHHCPSRLSTPVWLHLYSRSRQLQQILRHVPSPDLNPLERP